MVGGINRERSVKKAIRKKRISDMIYSWHGEGSHYYDNLHQFSKNKIHCSCPLCNAKTRNKGKRGKKNYSRAINYKHSDAIKVDAMNFGETDYHNEVRDESRMDFC